MRDLHELPKLRDGLSYLYLEHGKLDRAESAIEFWDKESGRTLIPVAALAVLMLGPGTSITHEAVKVAADNGCLILWCGEEGVRFYAQGMGETRKAYHLLRQAQLASDTAQRMQVVLRMYRHRFGDDLDPTLSLEQIRGYEGVRVREAYAEASRTYGVPWNGRRYDRGNWGAADPINRALSAASSCLNGICHAAIVSGGYSPALGFIHTGRQLSFVYDVADLYKVDLTVPTAFHIVAESAQQVETRARHACRAIFREVKLLDRVLADIDRVLGIKEDDLARGEAADSDPALPAPWWSPSDEIGGEGDGGDGFGESLGITARGVDALAG
jgi:CRISPR-associated protein Cas1